MSPKVTDMYKQQKKQLILEAAKKAFFRRGYELTTMKDIVDESGLSRGGVYLYFSSTEEIFLEILKINDKRLISQVEYLSKHCNTVWEAILELVEAIKKELLCIQGGIEPIIFEYFLSGKRNKNVQDLLNERFVRAMGCLNTLINTGIERNEFKPIFPSDEISMLLLSFLDGLEINMIHHGADKIRLSSQINQMILFLKYVLVIQDL
jgi:AcrR family transcriptional regulator